ncbi:MAG TPA: hypothetical protein VFJ06_14030 [Halococcus sp.]|nr:hypothetical protein [Halococcus sp.]
MTSDFYDSGLSQGEQGGDPRDLAEGDECEIPPHCGRCAKTLDDDERDLCPKCAWETGEDLCFGPVPEDERDSEDCQLNSGWEQ